MDDHKPINNLNGGRGQQQAGPSGSRQFLPNMNQGPFVSNAPDLLDDAYEYVKAQEESGFGDPLVGDNCESFDILQYINGANDTPEGSPATFCGGGPSAYHQQQQQMLGAAASELVQALQPMHKESQSANFQQPIVLDSVGLVMYNGHNGGVHQGLAHSGGHHFPNGAPKMCRNRQTRLPDSPPITDASGAGSSISPGSSGHGCESTSPFSPDRYPYVPEQDRILIQHRQPDMLLVNQMQLMSGNGHRGGMLIRGSTVDSQMSPQSEFLSPYPPSQSTPGSQHSSQVSPPAISHQSRQPNLNYLLQSQLPHPALSIAGSFASMDNLYTAANDALNGNDGIDARNFHHQGQQQQHGQKRRRMSSSGAPGSHESLQLNNNLPNIKSEIGAANQQGRESMDQQRMLLQQAQQQSFEDLDENMNTQRTIKFEPFMRESWSILYDANQQQLPIMPVVVVADKGFNYSASDNCFVNQKKNHFQITVNIAVNPTAAGSPVSQTAQSQLNGHIQSDPYTPRYVRMQGRQELLPILNQEFILSFCGVKSEMQTNEILIKQSQTDRKPIDHSPVRFVIDGSQTSVKQTVPRLHFSETTMNNHRKNGKPNPEQKYFLLAVKLLANTAVGPVLVQAFHSDRVIVRASNPGQFEQPEPDQGWKCQNGALTFSGPVCIGADKPIGDNQLTVNGNIVSTGYITHPSDRRVKEDITDVSTSDAMQRVSQMRIVDFNYTQEMAQKWGLSEQERHRVGVIAQELAEVLPDAVRDNGEFLTVDDTRIFYDTVAAAQELYRLTGNLECKIGEVEKISQKLARYAQKRKQLGSMASGLSDFSAFFGAGNTQTTGLDNKSCVSYSRTSLASTEEPNEGRKRSGNGKDRDRPQRHRCRSYSSASAYCNRTGYCHGPNSAICSSKVTQGTIVALVFIMALCLVTMCTLYVMDWYHRTYVTPFTIIHPTEQIPSGEDVGNLIELIWDKPIPPNQNAPPLSVTCPGVASLSSLLAGPFAPSCPQYCCSGENTYYEQLGHKIVKGMDSLVALATKFPHLLPADSDASINTEFDNGVKLKVLGLDMVLDGRYCLPQICRSDNSTCIPSCNNAIGRFDLYIPVDASLPTTPLRLQFSLEDSAQLVESCGNLADYPHKECKFGKEFPLAKEKTKSLEKTPILDQPSKNPGEAEQIPEGPMPRTSMISENVFEITAGSYLRSGYRFRVGHSTGLCQMDNDQRGRSFEEFNLIFYRTCNANGDNRNAKAEANVAATNAI